MILKTTFFRRASVLAAIFILAAGAAMADYDSHEQWSRSRTFPRFSISLDGGFGLADGHNGIFDAKTEFQFGFSRRIRIGLGVGYLTGGNGWGRDGRNDPRPVDTMVLETNGAAGDQARRPMGPGRDFGVVPVSLNVYYVLPLGRRWNLFADGGGSFYWGWFHGSDIRERQTAWGGQGGLGAEFRLSRRLSLVARGEYRFAEFDRTSKKPVEPASTLAVEDGTDRGRGMHQLEGLGLNGVGFHLGAKFGF